MHAYLYLNNSAEFLKNAVKAGTLKIDTLKTTAKAGLIESKIALKMLEKEGYGN